MPDPKPIEPMHLGDGAYVTYKHGYFVLTANHHDPAIATDAVHLDGMAAINMLNEYVEMVKRHYASGDGGGS